MLHDFPAALSFQPRFDDSCERQIQCETTLMIIENMTETKRELSDGLVYIALAGKNKASYVAWFVEANSRDSTYIFQRHSK